MVEQTRVTCKTCELSVTPTKRPFDWATLGCFGFAGWCCWPLWVIGLPLLIILVARWSLDRELFCPVCWYDLDNPPQSLRISAVDLWAAYTSDLAKVDAQYRELVVIVEGRILATDKVQNQPVISLDVGDEEALGIRCYFTSASENRLSVHPIGSDVMVFGKIREAGARSVVITGSGILPTSEPELEQVIQRFCTACGNQRSSEGDNFCRICGQPYKK